ncbi:MAG: hypothetical protein KC656_18710 [Myxococcales bacterium]|nr:hypothetical protein [Myxococcales bacterium]
MTAWLEVVFHDYWHIGSGRGGGPGVDARVRRTPAGLPYVPGRTLKGVLREAAGLANCDVVHLFGTELVASRDGDDAVRDLEEARFRTQPGAISVGSAVLGRGAEAVAWEQAAGQRNELAGAFVEELHRTAMEGGTAKDKSLRTLEVAVPMVLWSRLDGPPDAWPALASCLPLVTAIGGGKRRGLGRVELTLHVDENGGDA